MENKIFKIIKIIDEYNIIVNAGANHNIKEDDKLEVFVIGERIKDPETNEDLGTLDTIKASLIVKQVFPKFCICGNSKTTTTTATASLMRIAESLSTYNYIATSTEKLKVDPKEITGGLQSDIDDRLKIGDVVRKSLS